MMVTMEGTLEEIIYSNEANGYVVCVLDCDSKMVTAVGYMPFINEGETLRLSGRWVTHPDYGEQLKVEAYEKVMPQTVGEMEKYLSSGIVKGVGPATARKIIERFGEDTLHILQNNPERLSEIKGISLEKALSIGQAFDEQRELRQVVMFFQKYGISPTYAAKIYKQFGEDTIEEIKTNPYKLADEVFGIGFKKADGIARSLGIDPISQYRIKCGIKYVLSQAAGAGHTFMPDDRLRELSVQLLDVPEEEITNALISLSMDKAVYMEPADNGSRVYLSAFHNAELGVCKRLIELAAAGDGVETDDISRDIERSQKEEGIVLAEKQKEAVREALSNGVMVITGGPGTGKTTIIKTIIRILEGAGCRIALAAPTGRAAKRMTEATGFEAKTIHRLLEIGYMGEDTEQVFTKNENNLLEADVLIIDEMSMVDILLMNSLLKAVAAGTRLILAGDVDQLPSVGAGNVLSDIITSEVIRTVRLTEIFRQAEESMIIVNAHRINRGELPFLNKRDKDFFLVTRKNGEDIARAVVELCNKRLPSTYGYDAMKQIQVLTPTRKGVTGVGSLNTALQKVLNPESDSKNEKLFRDYVFREGDRVMQIRNNYNLKWQKPGQAGNENSCEGLGVFNGDAGIILNIDNEGQKITVLFEDDKAVEYDFSILDEIEPAYAITIHKSQGSEFPVVVMPVFPGPQILMTRNLLYTAVTRARNLVVLVGDEKTIGEMIRNEKETMRYSGLGDKLRKYLQK